MAASRQDGSRPSTALATGLVLLLCVLWGSTWIVIRGGLEHVPPQTSAGVRFAVAGVVMAVVAALLREREGGAPPPTWLWVVMGTTNFGWSYGVVYQTETVLPSGLVAVLWGVFPMMMAACGHWMLPGERLRPVQWSGFVLGLVGLVVLFSTDLQEFGPEGVPAALLLFTSPLSSTVGTVVVKRYGAGVSSLLLNRNGMLLGAALLLVTAALTERGEPAAWNAPAIGSVAYLAIMGTVVTFGLYFWLLRYAPANKLSLIAYVTPVVALTLGWSIGDEPVTRNTLLGTGLILGGVVLVVRRKPRARPG